MNIDRIIENVGLTPIETKIYLALLKLGRSTVSEIAKETKIKRTTIYPFLAELKSKRLIEWGINKYNKKIQVKEPSNLLRFVKSQERKYGRNVLKLEENFKDVKKLYSNHLADVELKYFEGINECREMMLELMNAKGEIYSYSSWMKYPYIGKEWCNSLYKKIYNSGKVKCEKELVSGTEHNLYHAKEYIKLPTYNKIYFFRFIPPKKEFINVDIHIFNDIKVILSFKSVKPNGIYIKNKDIVQSDRAIFEVLYSDVSLEYEKYLEKQKIDPKKLKHKH